MSSPKTEAYVSKDRSLTISGLFVYSSGILEHSFPRFTSAHCSIPTWKLSVISARGRLFQYARTIGGLLRAYLDETCIDERRFAHLLTQNAFRPFYSFHPRFYRWFNKISIHFKVYVHILADAVPHGEHDKARAKITKETKHTACVSSTARCNSDCVWQIEIAEKMHARSPQREQGQS